MGSISTRYVNMIRNPVFRRRDSLVSVFATPSPEPTPPQTSGALKVNGQYLLVSGSRLVVQ